MNKILFLSDLHIGTGVKLPNLAPFKNHLVAILGDLVTDGLSGQYKILKSWLKKYSATTIAIPGNHDYGIVGNIYSDKAANRFNNLSLSIQNYSFLITPNLLVNHLTDNITLIGLDSNLHTNDVGDFANGKIGDITLDILDNTLSMIKGVKIIALHHHPFERGFFMKLQDSERFMNIIEGKADLLMFGHKHVSFRWENIFGIQHVLASGQTHHYAREILITNNAIDVRNVKL